MLVVSGKVPFLRTEQGALCESQVIVDYLEAAYPAVPLLPADPFAAAKVRELKVELREVSTPARAAARTHTHTNTV